MSLFARKKQHPDPENTVLSHEKAEVVFEDPIEIVENTISDPLERLTDSWHAVYDEYRQALESTKGILSGYIGSIVIAQDSGLPAEPDILFSHRSARRSVKKISQRDAELFCFEAYTSARLRALGRLYPNKYPGLERSAAIYDEVNLLANQSASTEHDDLYLATSNLHAELYERFITIEEDSHGIVTAVGQALQKDDETRSNITDWILEKDTKNPEEKILLQTLGAHYSEHPDELAELFTPPERPSEFLAEILMHSEADETATIKEVIHYGRDILQEHGIATTDISDASYLCRYFEHMPSYVKEEILEFGASLNKDMLAALTKVFSSFAKDKFRRTPTAEDLDILFEELHAEPGSSKKKRRNSNGRTTKPHDIRAITPRELGQTRPHYVATSLVISPNPNRAKWELQPLGENPNEELINSMSDAKIVLSDSALHSDIVNSLNALADNPYLEGSKKTNSSKKGVFIDGSLRLLPRRSFAVLRCPDVRPQSPRGNDIRVVYLVYGDKFIVDGIFINHKEYERSLNT